MPTKLVEMTREMALRYITIAETAAEPELLDVLIKIITFKEMPTVLRERSILALRPLLTKTHHKITSKIVEILQNPNTECSLRVLFFHILLEQPTPISINAIVHKFFRNENCVFARRYIYERMLALATLETTPIPM